MKREASKRIYEELKGKTVEEQMDYWRKNEEKYANRGQETLSQDTER